METLPVGKTTCDYMDTAEFLQLTKVWFASDVFHHIVTLNPEMVVDAQTDDQFAAALKKADIRVPDGSGLIWARWYVRSAYWNLIPSLVGFLRRPAQRITGVDAMKDLVDLASKASLGIYLLGGTERQAQQTAKLFRAEFPGLSVHAAPAHAFDITGPKTILEDIRQKGPGLLLVAYGAPKQTLWIERYRNELPSVRVAIGVGGAFAMLSEDTPRAPEILRRHNLEWLWRLILEPNRFPRIWRAVVTFPALIREQKQRKTRR